MNWERVNIVSVASITNESVEEFLGEKIYIATGDLKETLNDDVSEKVTFDNRPSRANLTAKKGDVILARMKGTDKVMVINEETEQYIYSTGFLVLRPNESLDKDFLYYFLRTKTFQREKDSYCTGATQKAINNANFSNNLTIPLPPMSVQKEIVEKLDKAAAIREKSKALLAHYDVLAESLFIELFGDPISNEKGWEKKKLGEVIMLNPKKIEISDIDKTKKGSFLEMANVLEDGSIILCDDRRIDEMWKGYTYFAENDVLFAKITPCMENGKGAVVKGLTNGIGFGSTEFHVLRPKAGISDSYWIYGIIKNNKFRNKAKQNMKGSAGQKRVPTEFLNGFEIPLPPLSLQIKFAEMVENIEEQKARAKAEIEQSEAVFQALLQESFG